MTYCLSSCIDPAIGARASYQPAMGVGPGLDDPERAQLSVADEHMQPSSGVYSQLNVLLSRAANRQRRQTFNVLNEGARYHANQWLRLWIWTLVLSYQRMDIRSFADPLNDRLK
jgi:hypothetical protein